LEKAKGAALNVAVGNKRKDASSCFMQKHEFDVCKKFSAITEQESFDELPGF